MLVDRQIAREPGRRPRPPARPAAGPRAAARRRLFRADDHHHLLAAGNARRGWVAVVRGEELTAMRAPLKLLLAALAALAVPATSALAKAPAPQVSYAADKLAAGGYDVTAYFREGKPVRGSALHQCKYKGAT